ncbi:MAG: FAD-dependent oxidoreductase [Clostridiales bacterium]|nr:FAD-dependent oxidoreductase [Clostridiales bacterium]
MAKSLWSERETLPKFESLFGDKSTDVLIIGGGICGLLCAYSLQQAGIDYILLEGKRICSGITKNTTAKITSQHGLIYDHLIRSVGAEKAKMYLMANQQAIFEYEKLCCQSDRSAVRISAALWSGIRQNGAGTAPATVRGLTKTAG